MRTSVSLTAEQQAVVQHNQGPALVFAVAGAGKTTAMVHRIERLAREGVFAPRRILATSFGRATVNDLKRLLSPWPHCTAVHTTTLHALGRGIIQRAIELGFAPGLDLAAGDTTADRLPQQLLTAAITAARRQDAPYKGELDSLDRQDFLDYVSACKGRLAFADLERAQLPTAARRLASQARSPGGALDWYLDLYRQFEQVRLQRGGVTFDDMLLTGWQLLVSFPELLTRVQRAFDCVLVDEFQDINLAQSEMLDLITAPHRNLMAIGDDDQTIYEWRGADPGFILNFAARYDAATYLISNNFRCPAAPLALANNAIGHNKQRRQKRLRLTRGFHGRTRIEFAADMPTLARELVDHIQRQQTAGTPLNDIAVLVRLNAQTPHIEQVLIERELPYRITRPFYERSEIDTLIRYCRLGWFDAQLTAGNPALHTPQAREQFLSDWRTVCNRPKRYVNAALREQIGRAVVQQQLPLAAIVAQAAAGAEGAWLSDRLEYLAADLQWLAGSLQQPADAVLRELEARLVYKEFLRENSGLPQTGEGRAVGVDVFLRYAAGQGSLLDFMRQIKTLREARTGRADAEDAVTLSTIHQAKGREWPVVFLPQLNQDILPFYGREETNLEEERRLFYVGLTRTRDQLYISATNDAPLSPFLHELRWRDTLKEMDAAAHVLAKSAADWRMRDALLLNQVVKRFGLESYFAEWWPRHTPEVERDAVTRRMVQLLAAVVRSGQTHPLRVTRRDVEFWQSLTPEAEHVPVTGPFGVRLSAVLTAGDLTESSALTVLTDALFDPHESIRYLAVQQLSARGDVAVLTAVLPVYQSATNPEARSAAADVLQRLAENPDSDTAVRDKARTLLANGG